MSSFVWRTPPTEGLRVLENNVGSSLSPFLGCDEGEWNVGVDRREYVRLAPPEELELDGDGCVDGGMTEYDWLFPLP